MAMKTAKGKTLPIGLDLGTSVLKMAQLRLGEDGFELMAIGAVELPDSWDNGDTKKVNQLAGLIRQLIRDKGFKGNKCVLSLPADQTCVQHIRLPQLSPQETTKALRMDLQGKLPYSVEEAVIRHIVAGEVHGKGDTKQEVIVVSAAQSTLQTYLGMAHRAKLDIIGVNIEPCAIVDCFSRLFRRADDTSRTILFVDLGPASTQVVFSHGKNIVFARNLAIGGNQLDSELAECKGISSQQAHALRVDLLNDQSDTAAEEELYQLLDKPIELMAGELTQCLRYYESIFRNQTVERAIFLGGQAHDEHLCQSIARRLNLPAQVGDPLMHLKFADEAAEKINVNRREAQPDWAVAVGLSIGTSAVA